MPHLLPQLWAQEADHTKNQKQNLAVIEYTVQDLERKIKEMSQCLKKLNLNLPHLLHHHTQPPTVDVNALDLLKNMSHNLNPKLKQEVDLTFINLLKSLWYKKLYRKHSLKQKLKVDLRRAPHTVEAKRGRSRSKDPHDEVLEDEKRLRQHQAEILKAIQEKEKPKTKRASKRENEEPTQEEQKAKAKKISTVEKEESKPKAKPKQEPKTMLNRYILKKQQKTQNWWT